MRSSLEKFTNDKLKEAGLEFEYEGTKVELLPGFLPSFDIREWKGSKEIKQGKIRPITYTPDFMGEGWVIETKGHRTNEFNLKWKLFKYLMKDKDLFICLPRNQKQVIQCIEHICTMKKRKRSKRTTNRKDSPTHS